MVDLHSKVMVGLNLPKLKKGTNVYIRDNATNRVTACQYQECSHPLTTLKNMDGAILVFMCGNKEITLCVEKGSSNSFLKNNLNHRVSLFTDQSGPFARFALYGSRSKYGERKKMRHHVNFDFSKSSDTKEKPVTPPKNEKLDITDDLPPRDDDLRRKVMKLCFEYGRQNVLDELANCEISILQI